MFFRSSLSVIPQDPFLFSGSVRENLDPNYIRNDAEIWKALRHCHMEEKVQVLGGLDVRIEEMGQNFSNGERQLICLARALLQRAKVSIITFLGFSYRIFSRPKQLRGRSKSNKIL